MRYHTVLFDLDGTLIDTLDDLTASLNLVLEGEGYLPRTRDQVRAGIGAGYRRLLLASLPDTALAGEVDRCTALFEEAYKERMMDKTRPYPGIPALLWRLRDAGIRTAVISNKMDEATKAVVGYYFGDLLDLAVGDSPGRRRKPAPDNVWEALRLLGSEPRGTLYVGDSDIDAQTATAAGLEFLGVSWGYRSREALQAAGATRIVDRPEEVEAYIFATDLSR